MATSTAPTSETTLHRPETPRFHSGKTFVWGIVLILVVGFLAWLIIGHYVDNFEDLDQKRVKERQEILQKRNAEDAKLLNDPPSYLDKAKGQIRVPLDEAMKLALPALQANKPHAAYPLTQSPPQPAAAPTSPDKGAGSPKDGNVNPSASNPTLPQSSPGPSPATSPVPPSTTAAPMPSATPQASTAATSTPSPVVNNNALNPGTPPPSSAQGQPLTNPTPPAASSGNTPSPDPKEPGATPGSTP